MGGFGGTVLGRKLELAIGDAHKLVGQREGTRLLRAHKVAGAGAPAAAFSAVHGGDGSRLRPPAESDVKYSPISLGGEAFSIRAIICSTSLRADLTTSAVWIASQYLSRILRPLAAAWILAAASPSLPRYKGASSSPSATPRSSSPVSHRRRLAIGWSGE